jgi:hypothetical protein
LETKIPRPYGPDYWYERLGSAMLWMAKGPMATLDSVINERYIKTGQTALKVTKSMQTFEAKVDKKYEMMGEDFSKATPAKPWVGHHPEKSDMIAENFMKYGDYFSNFDLRVVDGVVNQAGKSTWVVSANTADFDLGVVDGVVDGIAATLHRYGDIFRKSVTGLVNDYTSGIVVGSIMLWILIVLGVR